MERIAVVVELAENIKEKKRTPYLILFSPAPFDALFEYYSTQSISGAYVPLWIIVIGGVGIDCGLAVLGYKVIKTVGEDIVKLTYSRYHFLQKFTNKKKKKILKTRQKKKERMEQRKEKGSSGRTKTETDFDVHFFCRGFAAQLGAATTVTLATIVGLPISTTPVLVGAIAGTGVIRGNDRKDKGIHKVILGKILVSWILTFVVGYCLCIVIFYLLRFAFV